MIILRLWSWCTVSDWYLNHRYQSSEPLAVDDTAMSHRQRPAETADHRWLMNRMFSEQVGSDGRTEARRLCPNLLVAWEQSRPRNESDGHIEMTATTRQHIIPRHAPPPVNPPIYIGHYGRTTSWSEPWVFTSTTCAAVGSNNEMSIRQRYTMSRVVVKSNIIPSPDYRIKVNGINLMIPPVTPPQRKRTELPREPWRLIKLLFSGWF